MKKIGRNKRIGALMKILTETPNRVFTYSYFEKEFNAAKSTISEDIVIAKELVKELELGHIETISGAAGGVKFSSKMSDEQTMEFLSELSNKFSSKDRLMVGGFIYMTDILYSPSIAMNIGKIFATQFRNEEIDYVVTVETKGIPIAMMTAQAFDVPLVIIRKNPKITEGATISINYISGSTKKIQTMALSKKSVIEGSKVLIIDDFMKAGGTAKGMKDMMKEFKADVAGIGVLISTEEPKDKLISDYISLLNLKRIDESTGEIYVEPNQKLLER